MTSFLQHLLGPKRVTLVVLRVGKSLGNSVKISC